MGFRGVIEAHGEAFKAFLDAIPGIELIASNSKAGYVGLLFSDGIPSHRTVPQREEIHFAQDLYQPVYVHKWYPLK